MLVRLNSRQLMPSSRRVLRSTLPLINMQKEVYIGTGQRISQAQAIPSSYPELLTYLLVKRITKEHSSTYIS